MKKCPLSVIKSVVAALDVDGLGAINKLGVKIKTISPTATKYEANIPDVDYFIFFELSNGGGEISFVCDQCGFAMEDIEKEFGAFEINYNFRENYSEFKIHISSVSVADLYFIKDNKFQIPVPGQIIETTPQGKSTYHSSLEFNGFCLRLRS